MKITENNDNISEMDVGPPIHLFFGEHLDWLALHWKVGSGIDYLFF